MKIQRYEPAGEDCYMTKDSTGYYVHIDDHDSAMAAKDARIRELEGEVVKANTAHTDALIKLKEYEAYYCECITNCDCLVKAKLETLERDKAGLLHLAKRLDDFTVHRRFPQECVGLKTPRQCDCGLTKAREALTAHAASKGEG